MAAMTAETEHLLCGGSWCKEVRKTLSKLHFIFNEVMMVRLVCWGEAHLLKERHCVHKQINTASKT